MNVEIRAEAVLFPEKEYIDGIAVAVHAQACNHGKFPFMQDKNSFFPVFPLPSFRYNHPIWYPFFFHFLPPFLSLNYLFYYTYEQNDH